MFKLKSEEEKLRQAMRAKPSAKPKRSRDSNANLSFRDHDEGSEDEGGISIAAIKNKYKKGGAAKTQSAAQIYSDSDDGSEGSDFETRRKKKNDKSKPVKALKESDDDESGSGSEKSGSGSGDEGSGNDSKKSKSGSDHPSDDD